MAPPLRGLIPGLPLLLETHSQSVFLKFSNEGEKDLSKE